MKRTTLPLLILAFGAVLLAPASAFANNPPAGNSMLYEMLMFLALVALTAAGGGYAVLSRCSPLPPFFSPQRMKASCSWWS
jgi:hypothetical protein